MPPSANQPSVITPSSSIQVQSSSTYALGNSDNTVVIDSTLNEDQVEKSEPIDWALVGIIVGSVIVFLIAVAICIARIRAAERKRTLLSHNRMNEQRERIEKKLRAK